MLVFQTVYCAMRLMISFIVNFIKCRTEVLLRCTSLRAALLETKRRIEIEEIEVKMFGSCFVLV